MVGDGTKMRSLFLKWTHHTKSKAVGLGKKSLPSLFLTYSSTLEFLIQMQLMNSLLRKKHSGDGVGGNSESPWISLGSLLL